MSLDATRWAWQKALSPSQKLVLLSLADRANETHSCFPSIARLEADTCLHRQTIMVAIGEMELMGLLTVKRVIGCGNTYTLIGVESRHQYEKPYQSGKPYSTSTKNRTTTSTKNRTVNLPIESISKPTSFFEDGIQDQNRLKIAAKLAEARKAVGLGPKGGQQ